MARAAVAPPPSPQRVLRTATLVADTGLADRSIVAAAPTRFARQPKAAVEQPVAVAVPKRNAARTLATGQVMLALALMVAAPALTLTTGKPSGLAFVVHGIGAALVLVVSTLALHAAYPLLRGGGRTWAKLKSHLAQLAALSAVQLVSSLWLLHYYLSGAGAMLARTTPLVDQLGMQAKVFCGLAGMLCFIGAWASSRRIEGERGDPAVLAPVFALAAGWMFMLVALAMGTAISWVMPT